MKQICWECNKKAYVEHHHPIPRSRGGTKTIPLCSACHSLAHDTRIRTDSLSQLIKQGLAEARKRGVQFGNPKLSEARKIAAETIKCRRAESVKKYFPSICLASALVLDDYEERAQQRPMWEKGIAWTPYAIAKKLNGLELESPRGAKISPAFVESIIIAALNSQGLDGSGWTSYSARPLTTTCEN